MMNAKGCQRKIFTLLQEWAHQDNSKDTPQQPMQEFQDMFNSLCLKKPLIHYIYGSDLKHTEFWGTIGIVLISLFTWQGKKNIAD